MILHKLSSKEIDFILYVAVSQDINGKIESVYYKDVCSAIDISIQKFYDILSSLAEKGLIKYEKKHRADICVKLVGNDFSGATYKKGEHGYLKVAAKKFLCEEFLELKAGSKLLYLYIQRFSKGKHLGVQKFYEDFGKIFQVTAKSLQIYVHELKKKCFLAISKKRNKSNNYEMTMKPDSALDIKEDEVKQEKQLYLENIKELVRRNFKCYLPEDNVEKTLQDIANLTATKAAGTYKNIVEFLYRAVLKSLEKQRGEGKKGILNAALINTCLSEVIEDYLKQKKQYA